MKAIKLTAVVFFYIFSMLASLVFNTTMANAQTLEELQKADNVRIKVWVEPEQNIIARQQVYLQIEVATDKWFSGGTQIGHFEIKDAIVLQREKFAVNSTRSEGEKNWTVQQWTLVVYPQRDGLFEVPVIPLKLSIAGDDAESIIGEVFTQPFNFEATIPEQAVDESNWITTSRFEIEESFNKTPDELKPGDALIRTIRMSADNLPAMMLPAVTLDDIQGIAVYAKPPQLNDKVNRGDYLAERTQVITYVFEKAGEYLLPKQSFYWWNLETESYEVIELEEHVLTISGSVSAVGQGEQASQGIDKNRLVELLPLIKKVIALLMILVVVWYVIRKLSKVYKKNRKTQPVPVAESELRKQFEKACANKELEKAMAIFYQWLDNYGGTAFDGSVRANLNRLDQAELTMAFENVMQSIYAREKDDKVDLMLFASQFISELKKSDSQTIFSHLSVDLKLN